MDTGMLGAVFILGAALSAPLMHAQAGTGAGLRPEVLQLARIKLRVETSLKRQPDYTCLQTIERAQRKLPSKRYRLVDTLRLEVALVEGQEMFAWPGDGEFRGGRLRDIIPTGAISTGNFASHARSVFLSNTATFTYIGEEERGGRRCVRFDYKVPLMLSGYTIRSDTAEALVAYRGSFWCEKESLDLVRLEVHAVDIPLHLRLESASQIMEYERRPIAGEEFLLPRYSVTSMASLDGHISRNETTFTNCRKFTGESFLSFEAPPEEELSAPAAPVAAMELPAGLNLELRLQSAIAKGASAIGDPITAIVHRDVKRGGEVVVPKGAVASGRIVHLETIRGRGVFHLVAVRFDEVRFDGTLAHFTADLVRCSSILPGGQRISLERDFSEGSYLVKLPVIELPPGASAFYVKGEKLSIPPETRFVWRTGETWTGDLK